jgi:tRNA-splicing ligase RtcB
MKLIKNKSKTKLPIKSWCADVDEGAMDQAINLANHPTLAMHVALMPDCHVGYGMPIGGVIASKDAVIPNAVGVDIGCGMCAVETNFEADQLADKFQIREILAEIKKMVPVGEGNAHKKPQQWDGFLTYLNLLGINENESFNFQESRLPRWLNKRCWELARANLGTLGGGNHFMEMQTDQDGKLWLMLHSGSRNLGYTIASYYHKLAQKINLENHVDLPNKDLAFLQTDSKVGNGYIRDMNFALRYAMENRKKMMMVFKNVISDKLNDIDFIQEINIHHNYAAMEEHQESDVWIHRKGATSAKRDELGIIPGSMGTSSYIVKGLGNPESFTSCSHGAGRKMGRMEACRKLSIEECDASMKDIVFDRWKKAKKWGRKNKENLMDLGEAPLVYKNIDQVIHAQLDLIEPLVKLEPLGVIKG